MKFRFTLTHRGSQAEPIAIPALTEWSTQTGADEEWVEGPIPSVDLNGTFITPVSSEWLYVDFGFEDGIEYSITLQHTTIYNSGSSNPRTVTLAILDNSFVEQFSEVGTFPVSPGGTDTITLAFTANSSSTKIGFKASSGSDVSVVANEVSGTGTDPGDVTESIEISEPDGWKQAVMKLARDKEFHSLVELFDGSFIFYGDNGVVNGGLHFIEWYEITRGVDVNLEILIEIAPDDETYERCFFGQLDLSLAERLPKNKFRIPIIRDNFWSKFNSRLKTPVDLQAGADLDGSPIDAVDPVEVQLISQKIRYNGEYNWIDSVTYPGEAFFSGLQLDWEETIVDDLKKFNLPRVQINIGSVGGQAINLVGLFEAPFDGDFEFDIRIEYAEYVSGLNLWDVDQVIFYLQRPDQIQQTTRFTNTSASYGSDAVGIATFNGTISLRKGEQLAIYGDRTNATNTQTVFGTRRLQWKTDVELATTIAISLSGEQLIDGVMTSTDRVLVKNQGDPLENGIYDTGAGAWTRVTDADTADELLDAAVFVIAGDTQLNTAWRQIDEDITVGVSPIRWEYTIPSDERFRPYPGTEVDNHLIIRANTTFKNTTSTAFLVHDAAAAILKSYGLGEDNPFYSELLGSALTNARQYPQDGCAWRYILLKGLQLRGYTLSEKPFSQSFEQWWKGLDPILCLALWYEEISGGTTVITEVTVDDIDTWTNAGGPFPGAWDFATFLQPFTSVNGDGGVEGYTCGGMATVGGQTYTVSVAVNIFESGVNPLDIKFIWAILDASFNEIETQQFDYTTYGLHAETFNITPSSDGTYLAVRVINDTVSETKTVVIRMAVGQPTEQLLLNTEFVDSSVWAQTGAGTAWTLGGDIATVSLTSSFTASQALTQLVDGEAGDYYFISEIHPSGVSGGDSITMSLYAYDEDANIIAVSHQVFTDDSVVPWIYHFVTVVPVVKIEIFFSLGVGTNVSVGVPYAYLFLTTPPEDVVVPAVQVIRVEEREQVFLEEMSVLISNIEDISRKYDTEKIYNKIEIGYTQWQSEDISGIDDPQTKHIYAPRFQKVGQSINVMSDFIAASLAIETTRRQTIEKSTDYKFDNNTFIIAINPDDVSPDSYLPELDENFSEVLNLLNSETRYNIRLSVARNFLRWRKWFNGCLQSYLSSFYKFVSGEGNFDMVSTMIDVSPDCLEEDNQGEPLSEKQDIDVTDTIIHTPFYYEFEIDMEWETYKTIRENRRNAIGISLTDFGHVPLFIDQLDYQVMEGKAKITGWTKEYFALDVIEGNAATQDCFPSTECDNPITDEFGENLTTVTGVCITA